MGAGELWASSPHVHAEEREGQLRLTPAQVYEAVASAAHEGSLSAVVLREWKGAGRRVIVSAFSPAADARMRLVDTSGKVLVGGAFENVGGTDRGALRLARLQRLLDIVSGPGVGPAVAVRV